MYFVFQLYYGFQLLLVHGNWSEWSQWSNCSQICGDYGLIHRNRSCNNPEPQHGGNNCSGNAEEVSPCNRFVCPGTYFPFKLLFHIFYS